MEEELLKIIYTYSFNYKLGDEQFVIDIANILSNYYHINDKMDFKFCDNKNSNSIASYNIRLKILSFNLNNMYTYFERNIKHFSRQVDRYFFNNFYILATIIHEYNHIIQEQTMINKSCDEDILKLLRYSFLISNENIRNELGCYDVNITKYEKYHDYFPIERMANINSYKEIIRLINMDSTFCSMLGNNYKYLYFNNAYLGYDNKRNFSAVELFFRKIEHKEFFANFSFFDENKDIMLEKVKSKYSLADRILYGFPLDDNEKSEIYLKKKLLQSKIEGHHE